MCANVVGTCRLDSLAFLPGSLATETLTEANSYISPASLETQSFGYNQVGNLTSKPGMSLTYGSTGSGTGAGPHQARAVNGQSYSYDTNGNLTSGGGRSYNWNAENQPAAVIASGVTETYGYDAMGTRVVRGRAGQVYVYLEGLWDETVNVTWRRYVPFNGKPVAFLAWGGAITYLHGDHLGSVALSTNSTGTLTGSQSFDAWGAPRSGSGSVTATARNYTGQYRDDTGLLYYNARYYDPAIGRFISADTVVPGNASGSMDGIAVKPLTVGFHETPFLSKLNQENQLGFWFQLSDEERQQVGSPWGPANPQALNRYSYVQNNPLKYTDPTGHTAYLSHGDAAYLAETLVALADVITSKKEDWNYSALTLIAAASARLSGPAGAILAALANGIDKFGWREIAKLREIASRINEMNGDQGVAIAGGANAGLGYNLWIMNRATGEMKDVQLGMPLYLKIIPSEWNLGIAYGEDPKSGHVYFRDDVDGTYLGSDRANCIAAGATTC